MNNNFKIYILDRNGNDIDCKSINNAKGWDISKYVTYPIFIEEKLNEELDTAQITLENFPYKHCLEPKTKIVIERMDSSGGLIIPYFHLIVSNDNVEGYVGLDGYYTHRINLIEASAIAQGYHVDNIACTYKLQDVDLNYDLNIDLDSEASQTVQNSNCDTNETNSNSGKSPYSTSEYPRSYNYVEGYGAITSYEHNWLTGTKIENNNETNYDYKDLIGVKSYKFEVVGNYGNLRQNTWIESGKSEHIVLNIPRIKCYIAKENGSYFNGDTNEKYTPANFTNKGYHRDKAYGTWEFLTDCETITTIKRTNQTTGSQLSDIILISKPQSNNDIYQEYYNNNLEYEDTNHNDVTYVALKWDNCKDRIKLCSAGEAENQTYDLLLESNIIYEIETKLNTPNNQAIIYSRVNITTGIYNKHMFDGMHCCAKFNVDTKSYGLPYAKTKIATTPEMVSKEGELMRQPQKYNLYNMLRKAILTSGDYTKEDGVPVIETNTNFIVDPKFVDRLKTTPLNETIFYEKNLWEVLTGIGDYIHALPFVEFYNNERFLISFRELGKNKVTPISNKKITIFNSKDIDEYFGSLDSYVNNLYNPENEIDEYLSFKASNQSCLVSNNTAIAYTSKPILQINKLYIINSAGDERDITNLIFEKSIYDTLSFNYDKIPSKGSAIYYTLGENTIDGLTYVPPQKTTVDKISPIAMKSIIALAFKDIDNVYDEKLNNYHLRIKYNTVDSSRLKQFKPNLNDMVLNSLTDKIPIHEQFYGQEAKFIDSERYGTLLYGELLKNGNEYYQYGEFSDSMSIKEVGDIEVIDSVPYYISKVESEWYSNLVMQKILYHKDFNSISKIISIPSEPRFYEISERSKVNREIHKDEFINITTVAKDEFPNKYKNMPKYINTRKFVEFIKGCLLGENPKYPDYAITKFYDDIDSDHNGYSADKAFINSYNIETGEGEIRADSIEVQNKISVVSLQNSLLFEWEMEDNFSAGNYVDTRVSGMDDTVEDAYYGVGSIRYCDIFGRADLFDFTLINNDNISHSAIQKLPLKICSENAYNNSPIYGKGKILNKDNRECLGFNLQINLITDKKINFGRAVWCRKKNPIKIFLLDNEISKFSYQNLLADIQANVISTIGFEDIEFTVSEQEDECPFVKFSFKIDDDIIEDVKCIAIVDGGDDDNPTGGMPYIFRNVAGLTNEQKRESFLITAIN